MEIMLTTNTEKLLKAYGVLHNMNPYPEDYDETVGRAKEALRDVLGIELFKDALAQLRDD